MPTDGAESARSGVGAGDSEGMSWAGPDDRSVDRARGSSEPAESENASPVSEARSWVVPARIYTFSAVLALAAAALWAKGPFLNASPIRHLTNQPEMFAVVCVLTAVTVWQPVLLHLPMPE